MKKEVRKIFDAHVHSIFVPLWDIKKLRKSYVTDLVTVSYLPVKPGTYLTILDSFEWIVNKETERIKKTGVNVYAAVGIHPRCIPEDINAENLNVLLKNMETLLLDGKATAIGEVGLEIGDEIEKNILREQIKLGDKLSVPVIVHTPRNNKKDITGQILTIISESGISGKKIIIDHITKENIDMVIETEFYIGLTVQKGKLNPLDFVDLVKKHAVNNPERLILNTDLGSDDAHLYSAKRAYKELIRNNVSKEIIKKVCYENAKKILFLPT